MLGGPQSRAIKLRAPLNRYFLVSRTLNSKGSSKQGFRAESPAQQVFLGVANSELKGAINAGLSSREPHSAARSNLCKQLRRLGISEFKGALKAGQGYRAESPAQHVFLRVANSASKGALKAGLSSQEPRSAARSNLTCLNSRGPSTQGYRAESPAQQVFLRVANSEFKGALKAGLSS